MKICFCACVSSERIDKFLSTALKIGRKKAVKLIENRLVKVNGFIAEKSFPVEKKSLIEADIPEPEANFNYSNLKNIIRR
jgi:RNA-binding protein YlmH